MEVWLGGPVQGVPPLLMPVAHALLQARDELHSAARGLTPDQVWDRPGGAASIGFHLHHVAGSIDRLLTYTLGRQLTASQLDAVSAETDVTRPRVPVDVLLGDVDAAIQRALDVVSSTGDAELLEPREVGRARLPSNVLGLLFHIAEHTQRHTGQVVTTSIIVRHTRDEPAPT